jgi:hypothetical protein
VRIEIRAAPYRVGICHCLDCRKRQGSLFHAFAMFPSAAVTVTGATREFKTKSFCPTCGSPLFDRWGDETEVHLGCLDTPHALTPTYESWVIRRDAWLPPFAATRRYERDRTSHGHTEP